jgi:defect-in-organelle-trafficking protein DotB
MNQENFVSLKYPNEPSRFSVHDIEKFIIWCVEQKTSDITIQNEDQIVCEIHGKIHHVTNRKISKGELVDMITFIYKSDGAISRLNGGDDVDSQWQIKIDRNNTLRFRINMTAVSVEGHMGYSITIRTITNRAPLLEDMKLPQEIIDNLGPKQGLILITGATGSGKSTLLASILDWRMRQANAHLKILTYESPIEYVYDDVPKPTSIISQSEIGTHLNSFTLGIRNALRRKPSVILMGELRDKETISEGVIASMTGHLVYGTLHSNGGASVVRRMVNLFSAEEQNSKATDILTSLKMIISQRLIPSVDGKRVAIREYLIFTEEMVDHLLETDIDNITYEVRKLLKDHGRTFLEDATERFKEGLISEKVYDELVQEFSSKKKSLKSNKNMGISDVVLEEDYLLDEPQQEKVDKEVKEGDEQKEEGIDKKNWNDL